ncbi:MAG TPA: AAA family ATPase [Thermoanaerobaculia bacterium]|nr:AAA family ATPase [Thermoanaerobaculia bacterium]
MIVFKGGGRSASGARTGLGKGFGGLVGYLTRGSREAPNPDRVAWVSYRHLDGVNDPAQAAQLMRAYASEHPRTDKPVYHFGLSLYPGEQLSREQWDQAVDRVLQRMGLGRHQALVIAHRDTEKQHVHIVVNRVGPDGRAWSTRRDMVRARDAVRRIEADFGLIRTGARDLPIPELTSGAYHQALRTGQQPLADRVREQAATAFTEAAGWRDLEARLAARGFRLEPAARGSGLLVTDGTRSASLSRVDRSLSGPKLARRYGQTFRDHRQAHPEPPTVVAPGRSPSALPGDSLGQRAAALLERVTDTQATFTEAHLRRAAFHQPESNALVREALRSDQVLDLGRDAHGLSRYTTRDYLEAEARLLVAATSLSSRQQLRLDPADLAPALDRAAPGLSAEQRAAVLHATTEADLAQIVGRAGAGKTTAARTVAAVYQERGYDVRGAALAGKAAEVLQAETGVPSRTLASLEHAWSEGADRLHPRSVLLVDEAGMVEVRRLGRILAHAEDSGAKVVLLGDPDQLKAIGAGDAFRGLLEQFPSARIDTIRRQHEPWQRTASEQLAGGRVAAALDTYEEAGRLHWSDSRATAQAELLGAHAQDRQQDPAGAQLILAYRNAEVAQLNAAIRAERRAAGELGPGIDVGGMELARGDRIVFLRNDNHGRDVVNLDAAAAPAAIGVRNGTLGTVVGAEPHRLAVRLDDGRTVAFDPVRYNAIAHGYAVTVHKSQGATMDRVYVLADPLMNRHAAYVALTRHRHGVDLFADRETFPSREHLDKALSRSGHKDLASDYASADLRRAVARLQDLAAKTTSATLEERPLREALAAHLALRDARLRVVETRRSLARPAAQVFSDPARALRNLLRDPAAPDRLRQGEARRYGALRGQALSMRPGRQRANAQSAVASLTGRLDAHQRSVSGLHAAKQAVRAQLPPLPRLQHGAPAVASGGWRTTAGTPIRSARMPRPVQIRRELARVTAALHAYRQASRGAQDAIEIAIRGMGRATVNSALLLLPPKVAIPVGLAVKAVSRVLDRGLDMGLGR